MPITLDATVGGSAANTLGSLDEAEAYFATRPYATAWTSVVDVEEKKKALIAGANRIAEMHYDDEPATTTQRLPFPLACDRTVIPEDAKIAQFEIALHILSKQSDPNTLNALAQFASIKVPGLSIETRAPADTSNDDLPDVVWRRLSRYLRSGSYFERG